MKDGKESGDLRRKQLVFGVSLSLLIGLHGPISAADVFSTLKISRSAAGTEAPSFSLPSLDGRTIASRELAGKVVLLNFWATWCGPCKEEMPSLQRLYEQFDADRFIVLAITTDLQPSGIKTFMHQAGVAFPTLMDEDQAVSQAFMVRGLPTTILIGPDGHLVGKAVGPRAWDSLEAVGLIRSLMEPAK